MNNSSYHDSRFVFDKKRELLWSVLTEYLQNRFFNDATVIVDFGAGYCNFINNVNSRKKYAIDSWHGIKDYAVSDVSCLTSGVSDLESFKNEVDVIFASNVLEHLDNKDVSKFMVAAKKALKKNGRLIILQPNFKYSYASYFDDYTHKSIWTDVSMQDFANSFGFRTEFVARKFLPLSLKSRLPVIPVLIRWYLKSRVKPMAGQMLLVFSK